MEFASIFNSFGSQVTVVEFMKEILPNFDTDIAKRLKQALSKRGIEIINQAGVKAVERRDDGTLVVNYEVKGVMKACEADTVLLAVAVRPMWIRSIWPMPESSSPPKAFPLMKTCRPTYLISMRLAT